MEGALRYADSHPRITIRGFVPAKDPATVARECEEWGAEGVVGELEYDDLNAFLGGLTRPLPIVNNALGKEHPGVVAVLGDFSVFVETAVEHLRQLGLHSIVIAVLEEGPRVREHLVKTFLRVGRIRDAGRTSLVYSVDRPLLLNPEAPVTPVPHRIAEWLRSLPRPSGVLCVQVGGGGYLIRCCKALGLRVPEDIAVIGSDHTDLSLASDPTLTSVLLSVETVGFECMKLLAGMMAGKPPPASVVRLRCADLQVRESTGLRRPEICDIAGALKWIAENACRGTTVDQVLRQTQRVSKVTFHRRFLEHVGKTPAQVIRDRKLEEVRRLLGGTELPVSMVSDLAGFGNPKVMTRLFRSIEGTTPREYRKRHRPA